MVLTMKIGRISKEERAETKPHLSARQLALIWVLVVEAHAALEQPRRNVDLIISMLLLLTCQFGLNDCADISIRDCGQDFIAESF
jgi:hypothetical protein